MPVLIGFVISFGPFATKMRTQELREQERHAIAAPWRTGRETEIRTPRVGMITGLALCLVFSLARQPQRADIMARRTIKPSHKRVVKRRGSQRIQREIAILQATIKLLQERIRVLKEEARGPRV